MVPVKEASIPRPDLYGQMTNEMKIFIHQNAR